METHSANAFYRETLPNALAAFGGDTSRNKRVTTSITLTQFTSQTSAEVEKSEIKWLHPSFVGVADETVRKNPSGLTVAQLQNSNSVDIFRF